MRFAFVTCVQLGLSCMEAIYEVGGKLDLVITLEDDMAQGKSGRIYVDDFAKKHGIPVAKVRNINRPEALEILREARIDWLFIIGWSQIAKDELLSIPQQGVLGMHPTLLPVGRGRAAIPWAILKGLDRTGVTMFKLDSGVDTGPLLAQKEIALDDTIDAAALYRQVDRAHVELMREAFPLLEAGALELKEQDESLASEWPGRTPEDGRIDLSGSVKDAERLVRAVTRPYPGAFVDIDDNRVIVWRAEIVDATYDGPDRVLRFPDGRLRCLETEEV